MSRAFTVACGPSSANAFWGVGLQMVWGTNYQRLAAATMFTLFFAGDRYAPNSFIDGVPVQEYLQSHYLGAMAKLVIDVPTAFSSPDTVFNPRHALLGSKTQI